MGDQSYLSKGCFVYKPKKAVNPFHEIKNEVWDVAFNEVWSDADSKLKVHKDDVSSQVIDDCINFINSSKTSNKIPSAVLLTGVNLPDHGSLFSQLVEKSKKNASSHVAILYPWACMTLKNMVGAMAGQFINNDTSGTEVDAINGYDSDEDDTGKDHKKSSLNMPNLLNWYNTRKTQTPKKGKLFSVKPKLIVIFPDFEGMLPKIVHDFLLILHSYMSKLPFVVVLGVATTASVISDMLEHSVTSQLSMELFQSQRSVHFLNHVLEEVFFTPDCPIQLGPKIFKFLINTFLFYDFSVQKFTLGIKYCVMTHFLRQPYKILCTKPGNLNKAIKKLTQNDLQSIRGLNSFIKYCETIDKDEKELLLSDDSHFKKTVEILLRNIHKKLTIFYTSIKLLHIMVSQLPGAPLGKQIRELYLAAMSGEIENSDGFRECCQLLNFQARPQLIDKLIQIISYIDEEDEVRKTLSEYKSSLEILDLSVKTFSSPTKGPSNMIKSRAEFKEKMAAFSRVKKAGGYEELRENILNYLMKEVLPKRLEPVTTLPLHEIVVCDSTSSTFLSKNLVGCPRADVHHALTQPSDYLMCDCCKLEDPSEISSSLPDICIAYKLHLEFGALINLHDWLQSFSTILDPDSAKDDDMVIPPLIQARFTQAVSDLEFMGFIKPSKRKPDHVFRMTWGKSV